MACPNPPRIDLVDFIRHIRNDVRWFARAVGNYERWFGNDAHLPPNTIVSYLDSALLHGRTLVEFFGHAPSRYPDVRACHYLSGSPFSCPDIRDTTLLNWKTAADTKLAHLTANRDNPITDPIIVTLVPQPSGDPLNHWNLLTLWRLLRPRLENLFSNSIVPNTRDRFRELVDEADGILNECRTWMP